MSTSSFKYLFNGCLVPAPRRPPAFEPRTVEEARLAGALRHTTWALSRPCEQGARPFSSRVKSAGGSAEMVLVLSERPDRRGLGLLLRARVVWDKELRVARRVRWWWLEVVVVTPVAATPNIIARATLSSQFLGRGGLSVDTQEFLWKWGQACGIEGVDTM